MQDDCDTSAAQVWHKCYTNDTRAIRVKNVVFDNEASENISSHLYISSMANERLQGEEQFSSKNYLLKMHGFRAKKRSKSAPEKLSFSNSENCIKKL